jgi:hypothetical protein
MKLGLPVVRNIDGIFNLAVIMTNQENRKEDGSRSIHF